MIVLATKRSRKMQEYTSAVLTCEVRCIQPRLERVFASVLNAVFCLFVCFCLSFFSESVIGMVLK